MSDDVMLLANEALVRSRTAEDVAARALGTAQDSKQETLAITSAVSNGYQVLSKEVAGVHTEVAAVRAECQKEAGYNRLAFEDLGRTVKAIEQAMRVSNPDRMNAAMADWMSAEALAKRARADERTRMFRLLYPVFVALAVWAASRIQSC